MRTWHWIAVLVLQVLSAQLPQLNGQSVTLSNILLDPPAGSINRLNITLQTSIGTDSEIANVTGFMTGILDFNYSNGQITPDGLALTGGDVDIDCVPFSARN